MGQYSPSLAEVPPPPSAVVPANATEGPQAPAHTGPPTFLQEGKQAQNWLRGLMTPQPTSAQQSF